jgi:hypothetical protein
MSVSFGFGVVVTECSTELFVAGSGYGALACGGAFALVSAASAAAPALSLVPAARGGISRQRRKPKGADEERRRESFHSRCDNALAAFKTSASANS